jgi:hypothetical protein
VLLRTLLIITACPIFASLFLKNFSKISTPLCRQEEREWQRILWYDVRYKDRQSNSDCSPQRSFDLAQDGTLRSQRCLIYKNLCLILTLGGYDGLPVQICEDIDGDSRVPSCNWFASKVI